MNSELEERLLCNLAAYRELVVAFSGGADSAFLLAVGVEALGANAVLAVTAISDSLPASELRQAAAFAAGIGVEHVTPSTHELDRDGYSANGADRCYFCKAELIEVIEPIAAGRTIATGTNLDDVSAGFRPGIRAARERGAVTPLLDAGFRKADVRDASRRRGLVTADKPAAACLSSRIAYGIGITPARLARVERAEEALRAALTHTSVRNVRVRDLDGFARVEVDRDCIELLTPEILAKVEGWPRVEADPLGFRSGSMNELLSAPGN